MPINATQRMIDSATSDPYATDDLRNLEPVHEGEGEVTVGVWTRRLVIFLRIMAGVSLVKGLYHWAMICGIGVGDEDLYVTHAIAWQTATVFFAVIDLVAAVGLWLAAAWGAVIWLTAVASILLLPTFIVGLYGQNFVDMPELHWRDGYVFSWVLIGVTTIAQVAYFRHKRWI